MDSRARRSCVFLAVTLSAAAFSGCVRFSHADVFYALVETPDHSKVVRIEVRGARDVAISDVGPTGVDGCTALAQAPDGTLLSMCGPGLAKPGPQRLTSIDPKTGRASTFGQEVDGLQVMGLKFGADGRLYTVGDTNHASPTYNSLYSIDVHTGALTRIGSTGAPSFFHDFALDRNGTMYATSSDGLYTIDLKSATANRVANFVGGGMVMGLSFNGDGTKLYATDWKEPISDVYLVDVRSGFLTPLGATGYALSHSLVFANH